MRPRAGLAWPVLLLTALRLCSVAAAQNAPPANAVADPKAVVQDCIDRLDGRLTGLPKLEASCPALPTALQAQGIRPLIIDSARALFDRDSLRQLSGLIHTAKGPMPPVSALAPILRQLQGTVTRPRTWWQRLWDWVLERFTPRQQENSSNPWLTDIARLLGRAHWLWTGIIWATLIGLPIGVVIVVRREVRALGRRSTDERPASAATAAPGQIDSRLALLRRVPLGQRPAQLFAMLIARLVAAGRLPPDRSLTHREVVRAVRLEDAQQRHLIESLARLSERQLYSGVAVAPAGLEELLARGEDLYTVGWSRPVASP